MRMFITRFVASGVYCVSTSRGSLKSWLVVDVGFVLVAEQIGR